MHPQRRVDDGIAGGRPIRQVPTGWYTVLARARKSASSSSAMRIEIGRERFADQGSHGLGARDRLQQPSAVHHVRTSLSVDR